MSHFLFWWRHRLWLIIYESFWWRHQFTSLISSFVFSTYSTLTIGSFEFVTWASNDSSGSFSTRLVSDWSINLLQFWLVELILVGKIASVDPAANPAEQHYDVIIIFYLMTSLYDSYNMSHIIYESSDDVIPRHLSKYSSVINSESFKQRWA